MLACHMPLLYNLPVYRSSDVGGSSQSDCASKSTTSFFCRAHGYFMRWFINSSQVELFHERKIYADKGITFGGTTEYRGLVGGPIFYWTITVVASVAINTTNFTCVIYVEGSSVSATAQVIVVGKYWVS